MGPPGRRRSALSTLNPKPSLSDAHLDRFDISTPVLLFVFNAVFGENTEKVISPPVSTLKRYQPYDFCLMSLAWGNKGRMSTLVVLTRAMPGHMVSAGQASRPLSICLYMHQLLKLQLSLQHVRRESRYITIYWNHAQCNVYTGGHACAVMDSWCSQDAAVLCCYLAFAVLT